MGDNKGQLYAKLTAVGIILLVIVLSVISGQSPVDVIFGFFKDIFVFLFFALMVLVPVGIIGYIFILCFTNFEGGFAKMSLSERTKQNISSKLNRNKKPAKKVPAKKKKKAE